MINHTPEYIKTLSLINGDNKKICEKFHAEKKEFLEYLVKFGNSFERAAASVVIDIAKGV